MNPRFHIALTIPALLAAQGAPSVRPHACVEPPPALATFAYRAPDPVAFGRLWMDVGLFHPFTGTVSRQAWETAFYPLMNEVAAGRLGLRQAAANAVGALHDPASMVLSPDEGVGACVLPLLFEARADGIWVIGGSKAVISEPAGPIETLNGEPLGSWLALRVGQNATADQQLAAMALATRSSSPKDWTLAFKGGRTLAMKSGPSLPEDAWIEGGWKGVSIPAFVAMSPDQVSKVSEIDLRALPWVGDEGMSSFMLWANLANLGSGAARHGSFFEVKQVREGYEDGQRPDPPVEYSGVTVAQAIPLAIWKTSSEVKATPPAFFLTSRKVAINLAGWALPKGVNAPGTIARYALSPQVEVRLRTSSITDTAPNAEQSLYGGPVDFLQDYRPTAYKDLSVQAAKDLAAASILDWTSLFGFIPTDAQAPAFKAIGELPASTDSVNDLLMKASFYLKDPHITSFALDLRDFTAEERDNGVASKHSRLPFIGMLDQHGALRVLRAAKGAPFKTGAVIDAINGRKTSELVTEMAVRVPTPENPFRICKDLGMLFPPNVPMQISYRNPGEAERTDAIPPTTYDGPWEAENQADIDALSKAGWTYIGKPRQIGVAALTQGLEQGKNYLIDCRFKQVPFKADGGSLPASVDIKEWFRRPMGPATWGEPTGSPEMVMISETVNPTPTGKRFKGKIAFLVWGVTQSAMETLPMNYRKEFLNHAYIVGTPSSGMTGTVAFLKLPVGLSDRTEAFSATGCWPVFNGEPIQYRGLPLDLRFAQADLQQEMDKGASDPYITIFLKRLRDLK